MRVRKMTALMLAGAMTASALGGAGANAIHSIRHGKNWKDFVAL